MYTYLHINMHRYCLGRREHILWCFLWRSNSIVGLQNLIIHLPWWSFDKGGSTPPEIAGLISWYCPVYFHPYAILVVVGRYAICKDPKKQKSHVIHLLRTSRNGTYCSWKKNKSCMSYRFKTLVSSFGDIFPYCWWFRNSKQPPGMYKIPRK